VVRNRRLEADVREDEIGPDAVPRPEEHPLEGGQTDAVDEAQDDARRDGDATADGDETGDAPPDPADRSRMASAARPGGGEQ
jgi:hypothetical protein